MIKKGAAHRQHIRARLEFDTRGLVLVAQHLRDGIDVDHHGAVHLQELLRVELRDQLLQRRADQPLGDDTGRIVPRDQRVFVFRAQEIDFIDRENVSTTSPTVALFNYILSS